MKSSSSFTILFVPILLFLLGACAGNDIYRDDYTPCIYSSANDCAHSAVQVSASGKDHEFHLGFVEYDDQGQLRDREQMDAVLNKYREMAGKEDVMLVAFVHGWHHNAKPGDSNIKSFRQLLAGVSNTESLASRQQRRNKRKVLGVYIGWRGESITVPLVRELTFWDRKNTAHDVGQQGVTELLLKLEEIINVRSGFSNNNKSAKSRLVVIGHSFGGAVVYTSLQKVLADRFINSRKSKTHSGNASGFGDLVVLMNPAFEALRFATLYDLSQEKCRGYFPSQLPRLAILTSESDYATKYAFPAGRFFSTFFESHTSLKRHYCSRPGSKGVTQMDIKEGEADRNTVGHFDNYLTHDLKPLVQSKLRSKDFLISQLQTMWARHTNDKPVEFEGSQLVSLGRTVPLNPYLNIRVHKKLIKDHNDIWRPEIISFVRDLITISVTPDHNDSK